MKSIYNLKIHKSQTTVLKFQGPPSLRESMNKIIRTTELICKPEDVVTVAVDFVILCWRHCNYSVARPGTGQFPPPAERLSNCVNA